MAVHIRNPAIQETKAETSQNQDQAGIHKEGLSETKLQLKCQDI